MKTSAYIEAGAPTRCQHRTCNKPFEGYCICGDNSRYSEACAQIGMEIDFDNVANLRKSG